MPEHSEKNINEKRYKIYDIISRQSTFYFVKLDLLRRKV